MSSRQFDKMYALIDCNNFFVSCERVFRPELVFKPVAVLSNNDGCIIARSNEIKALDIPMGVPLFKVKHLVKPHDITLFSANFELYGDMSQRIVSLLVEETPLIEVYSIDESFLDLSQMHIADYEHWARRVKNRIYREIGIPVSIGVAPTKTLAKVASTFAKTHGGTYVVSDDERRESMLERLPIRDIWGIGGRLAPKLQDKGVSYAGQLLGATDAWLAQQFNITGMRMIRELRGEPCLHFGDKDEERKSIMRSRSFGYNVRAINQLESAVATFAAQAAQRLRSQQTICRTVAVFLSTSKHVKEQKRVSTVVRMIEPTADSARIITAAVQALTDIYDPDFAFQKAGVILHDIVPIDRWQLSLMNDEPRRDERQDLMQSIDMLNKKYGKVLWHASEQSHKANWQSKRKLRSPRYTTTWTELPLLKA